MIKINKKYTYITIATIGVLVVLGIVVVVNSAKIFHTTVAVKDIPAFTFDKSKASGWWASENYNGQASATKDYNGEIPIDKLPVASMNIFKGKQGDNATACFIMFSYYNYHADMAKLKAEKEAGASKGGMQFMNVGEINSSINTIDGIKPYILTKYELSGPGTQNSMKGMSYGWIELKDGYIEASGVCPTAAELDGTTLVSQAVSLVKS